jgi:CO dehydrogenase/acetyl-CoA synthase beta subunit
LVARKGIHGTSTQDLEGSYFLSEEGSQCRIVWKLKVLKTHTKLWIKERIGRNKLHLETLETEIKDTIMKLVGDVTNYASGKTPP